MTLCLRQIARLRQCLIAVQFRAASKHSKNKNNQLTTKIDHK